MSKVASTGFRWDTRPWHALARVSIEAGCTFGWSRWIGDHGRALGIDRFGASAPGGLNLEQFGFTGARVAETARSLLQ